MSLVAPSSHSPVNRLGRFRDLMARLDATGRAEPQLQIDVYVSFPDPVGEKIAGRLLLRPSSSHLVIGGVGSGKTTELLFARAVLAESPDRKPFYVDITKSHDIAHMKPGVVIVQVGLEMAAYARNLAKATSASPETVSNLDHAIKSLEILARGYYDDPEPDWGEPGVFRPGLIVSPQEVGKVVAEARDEVKSLVDFAKEAGADVVVLLDGLDRLPEVAAFENVIDEDVKALTGLGVGVVLVGPLKTLFRTERVIADGFDYFYYQPWRDPRTDPNAAMRFAEVLRRRLDTTALDDEGLWLLVQSSGGVFRDLITLAQFACEEAFIDGADIVGRRHVEASVDAFGRKHMLGLQADEIEVLQRVRENGTFVQTSEKELALLMTRRVLTYGGDRQTRYCVHPTIEPLLRQLAVPF